MSLNAEETKLVQSSWDEVCGKSTGITETGVELFIRIFTASPEMQQFFKFAKNKTLKQLETSPRLAIHASNIMNVVGQGVANAADLSCMVDYLTELGGKHNKYGAEDQYFDLIGSNLVELLKEKVGHDKWTDGHTAAWCKLYAVVKNTMMKGLTQAREKQS